MIALFQLQSVLPQPSLLSILEHSEKPVPKPLLKKLQRLKKDLRHALSQDYLQLESSLEALLPQVWDIRMQAIPVLVKMNLQEAMGIVALEFASIPQRFPSLAEAVKKLDFGLHLMTDFLINTIEQSPSLVQELAIEVEEHPEKVPVYEQMSKDLAASDDPNSQMALHFVHGSLMIELLVCAVDLAADEQLPLEFGMLHELKYQSAVAVEEYAAMFGLDKTKMPWYSPPKNDFQRLLLSAPVATAEQIQFIQEKRAHFNTWQ